MSGGIRTSVKGYLLAQRLTLALDPLLENENINNNVTAPLDPPPHPVEDSQETTMDSTTYGLGICDGNIPCFPMLNSAKSMASYRTRTRAESPPPQGVNLNSNIPSVSVPLSPQTEGERLQSFNLKSFHYNELKTVTRNFRPDGILSGGFCSFYKGWIDERSFTAAKPGSGMAVAIKRLNQQGTLQSHKEWMEEVNCVGQLSHPNLVKLIGYCLEDDKRLLVYEFVPKGSLENHILRKVSSCFQILSWNLRMKIALGAAKALAFLHDEAKCIYVDFETSKILLDSNYNVKIYGYGLAQEGPEGYRTRLLDMDKLPWYEDKLIEHNGGPYTAPEYIFADHLTPRSDVYSFGVVLLEILSGRRAIDISRPVAEHDLVRFAFTKVPRKQIVHQIIDIRMEGHYSKSRAVKALKLARQCLSVDSKLRPDMHQVIEILENLQSSGDREASLWDLSN
ncbi:receptor-like cytoplasmic kinase 176 isoform X2 [Rosa rugosa]|uniref:receptor-like cytoplasmic kinase 176 isoform X2 n=1 Tax=Rosa rugosa TaxID=74645 RepID=UPI002B40F871|nr:receptor-like cytoplasmic kinase 176 isoform X2 [Rosa rugosa]